VIDTHMHLDALGEDGPALVQAAVDRGVTGIVSVGVDPRASQALLGALPQGVVVKRALGLHPQEVRDEADVDDALAALDAVNVIAPEHLELLTADPHSLVPLVRNAGAVFLGPWAPAALGDYVAGVNHVLPTDRTARFASALRVDTFRKHLHVVDATEAGLTALAPHVRALAAAEGLDAHARSVDVRSALTVPQDQQ
jgi:histidinol dehydrogenase